MFQVVDLLWSDPRSLNGCQPNNMRGGGSFFGPDITEAFLKKNDLSLIIRSHECKVDGYEFTHNNKVRFSVLRLQTAWISSDLRIGLARFIADDHQKMAFRNQIGPLESVE